MKTRILIPTLIILTFASTAFASEITGTLSAGSSGSGSSVTGTVVGIPTADPAAGTYAGPQSVTLTSPGSTSIVYTTDGITDPSCTGTGTIYTAPISVPSSMTILAVSCYPGAISSSIGAYPYVISGGSLTGTVSPSSGSLTGTVSPSSGSLTGTVASPSAGSGGGGGGGGGGSNGPPAGGGGGGGEAIIPTGSGTPPTGEVLGASTTIPNLPDTGAGGDAASTLLALALSLSVAGLGGFALRRSLG